MSKKAELLEKAEKLLTEMREELNSNDTKAKETGNTENRRVPEKPTIAQIKEDIKRFNEKFDK